MKTVNINGKAIGKGHPTYVIAEIGINHNGEVKLAKDTIDAAIESGADAVKLQTYSTEGFVHPDSPIFDAVKSCELTKDEYIELFDYAKSKGAVVFSTPECLEDIEFLKELNPPAIKIASMDMNYRQFVQKIAESGSPVIISTGMSYMHEVANSVRWIEETGNSEIILLHCVSCYPTPSEECNLSVIPKLASTFGYPTGFSDHTVTLDIPFASACLGANLIEKHFTLDKTLKGPDHAGSADPEEMKTLINWLCNLEKTIGNSIKEPSKSEKKTRLKKRRSIYAKRDLEKGYVLTIADVQFLTPSAPESQLEDLEGFLGRQLKDNVKKDEMVTRSLLIQ
jgi:sialic acid synthase SpsE